MLQVDAACLINAAAFQIV